MISSPSSTTTTASVTFSSRKTDPEEQIQNNIQEIKEHYSMVAFGNLDIYDIYEETIEFNNALESLEKNVKALLEIVSDQKKNVAELQYINDILQDNEKNGDALPPFD